MSTEATATFKSQLKRIKIIKHRVDCCRLAQTTIIFRISFLNINSGFAENHAEHHSNASPTKPNKTRNHHQPNDSELPPLPPRYQLRARTTPSFARLDTHPTPSCPPAIRALPQSLPPSLIMSVVQAAPIVLQHYQTRLSSTSSRSPAP